MYAAPTGGQQRTGYIAMAGGALACRQRTNPRRHQLQTHDHNRRRRHQGDADYVQM